jgi:hypothetical protein
VLTYCEGTHGWNMVEGPLPYDAYDSGEPAPSPQSVQLRRVDIDEAAAELRGLGIL